MIHKLKQIFIIVICAMQIIGIQLAVDSLKLPQAEAASMTLTGIDNNESLQSIPDKESVHVFLKESYNNSKLATPRPF